MKYLSLFFAIILVWFAYLQLNDPDPIIWTTVYLIASYISWRAYAGLAGKELILVLLILCIAAAINSGMQMTAWEGLMPNGMAMKTVNQELAREALGLVICAFSFVIAFFQTKN